MFLIDLIKPQIAFGSGGGSSGGGGGGSSKSSSSQSRSRRTPPKPAPKPKSSGGGKGSKSSSPKPSAPKSSSKGRNLDADMFAGSGYAPTKDAGTSKARQVTYSNDTYGPNRTERPVTGSTTNFQSKTSVTAKDLKDGNVTTYRAKNGVGSVTVAQGTAFKDVPQVDVGGKTNAEVYDTKDVATPSNTGTVNTGGGSSTPVTAPEKINPKDGVGGGRDGGKASRLKASKTEEDKISLRRKATGTSQYRTSGGQTAAAATKARTNPMSIRQSRNRRT
ncbi:hypothetical protein CRP118_gp22 [Roseobacter phage CRP-118]|uniref:Uncharacterized protein n=1 Tax=Roseobacter phage CRP-118 TaxID=3072843 RepID=A0AAX4G2K2_9CAUD|nr:hypothetical protein CRP118_gp22 [Roseobacter phage CRP-118]